MFLHCNGKIWFVSLACSLLLWYGLHTQATESTPLPMTELVINGHRVQAEVAATEQARIRGLKGRIALEDNHGMLFVWQQPMSIAMWMQDTLIPLSVAFITAEGHIINIEHMQPLTHTLHRSNAPAQYALEMRLGWFEERGIIPGMRVYFVPAEL